MAFKNGQANPEKQLAKTILGFWLELLAARSFNRLNAAFKKRFGYNLTVTSAYRALNEPWKYSQEQIFLDRYRVQWTGSGKYGDVRWWKGKRYVRVQGAAAAIPATSNHGWGLAIDVSTAIVSGFNSVQYRWLLANAGTYGWDNVEGKSVGEWWHWTYNKNKDKRRGTLYTVQVGALHGRTSPSTASRKNIKVTRVKGDRVRLVAFTNKNGYRWGKTVGGIYYAIQVLKTGEEYAKKG